MIFFTGHSCSASSILKDQKDKIKQKDPATIASLHYFQVLDQRTLLAFDNGRLDGFAQLMNEHWEHKRNRSAGISTGQIDEWYELARAHGALGGKLILFRRHH